MNTPITLLVRDHQKGITMFATLVLNVTYKCPIDCDLCGLSCNPKRKERMSLDYIKKMIDEVAQYKIIRHVTFTGGEPFLLKNDLLNGIAHANSNGLTTRVVTNAYWAKTFEKAFETLGKYQKCGLTEINISVDDMHQEHIPVEYVKNAHHAAVKLNMNVILAHKALKKHRISIEFLEELLGKPMVNLEERRNEYKLLSYEEKKAHKFPVGFVYNTSGCIPVGPNSDKVTDEDLDYCYNPIAHMMRCDSVLNDVIVSPDGKLEICCGVTNQLAPEYAFEGIDEHGLMGLLKKANDDLIVNWLALEGPYGMKKYLEKKDPTLKFDKKYVNNCHLCGDILSNNKARQLLRNIDKEKIEELFYRRKIYDLKRMDNTYTEKIFKSPPLLHDIRIQKQCF